MSEHELKLDANFFDAVLSGDKPFEVRKNDRGFQKGDSVLFKETIDGQYYCTYRRATAVITYVLSGWGIENGYVVFGITDVQELEDGEE